MNRWRLAFFCFLASTASCAQAEEPKTDFSSIMKQIDFRTSIRTPDILDPAVIPYLECKNPDLKLDRRQGSLDLSEIDSLDCDKERELAVSNAKEILAAEGITDAAQQNAIIGETLFVIDLHAETHEKFGETRSYGKEK